jgi:hypothetical protein
VRRWLLAAAAYAALAVAVTWPVAARLSSSLPHDAYDPALVTWILWWNAHAPPFTAAWWNAPFFWPMTGALALSETLVGISVLTTPLQWAGLTPAASYNVAFIASFALAALACHALAFALIGRHDAAAVGAAAFAFGPYRAAQWPHLQMLWTFGLPLALFALHRHGRTRQTRWLVLFAIAWSLLALSNGYLLLFVPILLVMWIAWHVREARHAALIGVAWLAGSLPLLPILVQYEQWQGALSLSRRYDEIQGYSADVLSIVSAAPELRVWGGVARTGWIEEQFFPGVVVLLLVAAGIVIAAKTAPARPAHDPIRRVRQVVLIAALAAAAAALSPLAIGPWAVSPGGLFTIVSVASPAKPLTIALLFAALYGLSSPHVGAAWRRQSSFAFYLIAAATTFVLALGPLPRLGGRQVLFHSLYWWLLDVPGFATARVPARFGAIFELCLVVAASLAFARMTARLSPRARIVVAATAAAAIVVEGWPAIPLVPLPPPLSIPIARGERVALFEVPFGTVETDTAALWRSMQHRLPIVNGYSGFQPVHYVALKLALDSGDERVLDALSRDRDLVVALDRGDHARWSSLVSRHPRASRIGGDGRRDMYRIARAPGAAIPQPLRPIAIARVRTTDRPEQADRLVDGSVETVWTSGRPQTGREEVEIDFGREIEPAALKLGMGGAFPDFPRRLDVECATSKDDWRRCWAGSAAALLLDGALADPRNPTMTIAIDADRARWIRLRQTGTDALYWWTIAEVSAFAR